MCFSAVYPKMNSHTLPRRNKDMKRWIKPAFVNRRLGFEINLYINNR